MINCSVTGNSRYSADLLQGGMKIPSISTFKSYSRIKVTLFKSMMAVVKLTWCLKYLTLATSSQTLATSSQSDSEVQSESVEDNCDWICENCP